MRLLVDRDIPWRAAVVVIALVLLATVVTGREQDTTPDIVAPAKRSAAEPQRAPEPAALDLTKLVRMAKPHSGPDLFSSQAPAPPPAPVVVAPPPPLVEAPPAPVAPRLPFAYLGQMRKGDRVLIYLLKNQELLITEPGATLDKDYRIEGISETAVSFVYLPLDTKQVLRIPARE